MLVVLTSFFWCYDTSEKGAFMDQSGYHPRLNEEDCKGPFILCSLVI